MLSGPVYKIFGPRAPPCGTLWDDEGKEQVEVVVDCTAV
jgi:hypothetical protein